MNTLEGMGYLPTRISEVKQWTIIVQFVLTCPEALPADLAMDFCLHSFGKSMLTTC